MRVYVCVCVDVTSGTSVCICTVVYTLSFLALYSGDDLFMALYSGDDLLMADVWWLDKSLCDRLWVLYIICSDTFLLGGGFDLSLFPSMGNPLAYWSTSSIRSALQLIMITKPVPHRLVRLKQGSNQKQAFTPCEMDTDSMRSVSNPDLSLQTSLESLVWWVVGLSNAYWGLLVYIYWFRLKEVEDESNQMRIEKLAAQARRDVPFGQ